MNTEKTLQAILRDELNRLLDKDIEQRIQRQPNTPVYAYWWDEEDGTAAKDADLREIEASRSSTEHALSTNQPDPATLERAERLLVEHNLPPEMMGRLTFGLLEAAIKGWEAAERRTLGKEPLVWAAEAPAQAEHELDANPSTTESTAALLPLASTFAKDFTDWGQASAQWRKGQAGQAAASFALFLEIVKDRPVNDYTAADGELFRATLRQIPANYRKSRAEKVKPIQAIIADAPAGAVTLAEKTIKRHFWALSQFFKFLIETGRLPRGTANPMRGFTFKTKGTARSQRKMWTGEDLKALFSSPVWTGGKGRLRATPGDQIIKDALFWLPLLGAFHGNRLEEFAQLRGEDVGQEGGVWFLNITDDDGRQLKNQQSRRRIPLHSELMKLGFLDYVRATASSPDAPVFPDLRPGGPDQKLGFYFSKDFSRYRQNAGVYQRGLDYHSFRHSVTTKLYEAEVNEGWIDLLTGHESGGESRRRYLKGIPLVKLKEAIEKVTWPEVDLSGLYPQHLSNDTFAPCHLNT